MVSIFPSMTTSSPVPCTLIQPHTITLVVLLDLIARTCGTYASPIGCLQRILPSSKAKLNRDPSENTMLLQLRSTVQFLVLVAQRILALLFWRRTRGFRLATQLEIRTPCNLRLTVLVQTCRSKNPHQTPLWSAAELNQLGLE